MRHVPDEELHAYLDQALSRSQCVEIETHMAECARCRDQRDTIAALRDRTTALLGQLTPRALIIPPPYEALAERLSRRPVTPLWQVRLRRASMWAAGVMAAVGAGWMGRSVLDPHREPVPPAREQSPASSPIAQLGAAPAPIADSAAATPEADFVPEATRLPPPDGPRRLVGGAVRPANFRVANATVSAAVIPAPLLQLASVSAPIDDSPRGEMPTPARNGVESPFDRLWQSLPWEEALAKAGSGLPFIEGLPVLGVLFQQGERGERPTSIVAQQDPSGEIILSIEGPTGKVNDLLKRQSSPDFHASEFTRTTPDYVDETGRMRRNNRILTVTGRISVDSLNALARIATIR